MAFNTQYISYDEINAEGYNNNTDTCILFYRFQISLLVHVLG